MLCEGSWDPESIRRTLPTYRSEDSDSEEKNKVSGPACPDTSGTSQREERDESPESLSKGNLATTSTISAKFSVTGVYIHSVVEATVVSGQWLGYRS